MTSRLARTAPRTLAATLALAAALAACPARALEIGALAAARDDGGALWVTTRLVDPLEARVERSLARGMPATLQLHAELWRRRDGWLDRLVASADAVMRMHHDVWRDAWVLERSGAPAIDVRGVDSLETALSRPLAIPVPGLEKLAGDDRCYVVVTATVKPLSLEDAAAVEGWVSGEVRTQKRSGFGVITQLPRSLFDAVRNFTGFGDSRDQATSPEFSPDALPAMRRP